jgi:hypothetical protein
MSFVVGNRDALLGGQDADISARDLVGFAAAALIFCIMGREFG